MKGLTQRQREVMDFIQDYISHHTFSPSYREIMHKFGFSSLGSVYKHVQVLKRKGVLLSEKQCSRSLSPVEAIRDKNEAEAEIVLPFMGCIAAGNSIETFPQVQTIAIPHYLVPSSENTYVLRAKGDSLMEELIADGDLIIVEARHEAHPGETVLVLINQSDTFIKRYYPEDHYVRLESRTAHQHPIMIRYEDLMIQGVVVGLLRLF